MFGWGDPTIRCWSDMIEEANVTCHESYCSMLAEFFFDVNRGLVLMVVGNNRGWVTWCKRFC